MNRFTDQVWESVAGLRQAIHDLPFNRDLAAGTLSRARFQHYMVQDSLYLIAYGRALAIAAAKAPNPDAMVVFAAAAREAVVVERALHGSIFAEFGLDPQAVARTDRSPACQAYTDFLIATAQTEPYESLIAAILPCFWVYWDVGTAIAGSAAPNNPYQTWIDTYADPGFGEAVARVKAINDEAAAATTGIGRAAMLHAFKRSTQYEWMFWDSAYRLEAWPIG